MTIFLYNIYCKTCWVYEEDSEDEKRPNGWIRDMRRRIVATHAALPSLEKPEPGHTYKDKEKEKDK